MKRSDLVLVISRILIDGAMIWLGLMLAFYVRMFWFDIFSLAPPKTLLRLGYFQVVAAKISLFLIGVMTLHGRYRLEQDEKVFREIAHVFWAFSAGFALLLVAFFFTQMTFFSRLIVGMGWIFGLVLLLLGRAVIHLGKYYVLSDGHGKKRVIILGTHTLGADVFRFLSQNYHYEILGFCTDKGKAKSFEGQPILGTFADFEKVIQSHHVDEVILAGDLRSHKDHPEIVQLCHIQNIKFQFVPDQQDVELSDIEISTLDQHPLITILNTRIRGWGYIAKTIIDYVGAVVGLILMSPFLLVIAFFVWRDDPSASIFYAAERVGRRGKLFWCYKFRTMVKDADAQKEKLLKQNERKGGVFFKIKDDPRVTRVGAFLRRTSLDELPQLWNVLRGEMSLVGPRPHLPEEVKKYQKSDRRLIGVKPGMTGFAQVNGLSHLSFQEEMQLELIYLKKWSLWLDTIIVLKTLVIIVKRRND